MGQTYDYRGVTPTIGASSVLFPTAEVTGDVVIGERTIIGAGVKIIGDSHGPVRIGDDVQILENTVLHLLPDNELRIDDGVTIGPGAMIHGCHIGARTVVEPGAIVCDGSVVGADCVVRAGAVVKQRSRFDDGVAVDGFPAVEQERVSAPERPAWRLEIDELPQPASAGRSA
jgi:carbonic anhydrase/acetyltransferase-like protein (isoleucine patch superfamily)